MMLPIATGIFWMPMLAPMLQEVQGSVGAQVPHPGRLGKPEEYAELVRIIQPDAERRDDPA